MNESINTDMVICQTTKDDNRGSFGSNNAEMQLAMLNTEKLQFQLAQSQKEIEELRQQAAMFES